MHDSFQHFARSQQDVGSKRKPFSHLEWERILTDRQRYTLGIVELRLSSQLKTLRDKENLPAYPASISKS